jgi:hypothetical protein
VSRGRKPKAPHLRLIEGTHRPDRHGDRASVIRGVEQAAQAFGHLTRPTFLKQHARRAWDRYIAPAFWLDASREPSAIAFCELWQEMRSAPSAFQAAKHSQLRGYMADLGLTDLRKRAAAVDDARERDEHFDD